MSLPAISRPPAYRGSPPIPTPTTSSTSPSDGSPRSLTGARDRIGREHLSICPDLLHGPNAPRDTTKSREHADETTGPDPAVRRLPCPRGASDYGARQIPEPADQGDRSLCAGRRH